MVFVEGASSDGDSLWGQVDNALAEGCQVWLRSPLLAPLADVVGREHDGRRWLVLDRKDESGGVGADLLARCRDVLLSGIALIVLSPLFGVVAALVKLTSPGPIFYTTTVVGRGRCLFAWRKFRSMTVLSEAEDVLQRRAIFRAYVGGNIQVSSSSRQSPKKVIDESRVTPVGRFLRKHSIDELPQLWNVLRGEMALVGPRPCLPYEAEFYTSWRQRRFDLRPGLTGVWQVYGRGQVGFDQSVAMDVYYSYRRSFAYDLNLMLKTVGIVLRGSGAR